MTGIYFRVVRDGKSQSMEMELMTKTELTEVLANKDPAFVLDCLHRACAMLREVEQILQETADLRRGKST